MSDPRLSALDTIAARSVLRYLNNHSEKKFDPKVIASMRAADTRQAIAANYAPEAVTAAIDAVQTAPAPRPAEALQGDLERAAEQNKARPAPASVLAPAPRSVADICKRRDRILAELDQLEADEIEHRIGEAVKAAVSALEQRIADLELAEISRL